MELTLQVIFFVSYQDVHRRILAGLVYLFVPIFLRNPDTADFMLTIDELHSSKQLCSMSFHTFIVSLFEVILLKS